MNIKKIAVKNLKAAARIFGIEVIPKWQTREFPLSEHLCALFKKYEIEIVIDVGANKGQYRDLLRNEVGFKGLIISFEPLKDLASQLKESSISDSACLVYGCALGSAPGEAMINVTKESALSSFLKPRIDVLPGMWKKNSATHAEMVQIRTLDEVLEEAKIDCKKTRIYLKLDTQGFDLEVLKGAAKSLEHIIALQTEASIKPIYEGMPGYREALDSLDEVGYEVSGIFPVTYDGSLRLVEFDCVMINRRFIVLNEK